MNHGGTGRPDEYDGGTVGRQHRNRATGRGQRLAR